MLTYINKERHKIKKASLPKMRIVVSVERNITL